jgi:prepilin-type N-terminal cleavage/methylation domain-containing protein/prepilin-type processing-associated H-X9-DG protein
MTRRGFTLIELLVVIAVLGVLVALLSPAVQAARGAALGLVCRAHLRDLTLATNQYLATNGMYPGWVQRHQLPNDGVQLDEIVYRYHAPSIQAQLLPYMEASVLYDAINFSRLGTDDGLFAYPSDVATNSTVRTTRVASLLCPVDPARRGVSYRATFGVGPAMHRTMEFPDSANGLFGPAGIAAVYPVTTSDVSDGLSHTAAFSERVVGPVALYGGGGAVSADDMPGICHAAGLASGRQPGGVEWLYSGIHQTLYTHALPPNSAIEDCVNFGIQLPYGAIAARSNHGTSVNVAMGDGSVRVVDDGVSLSVWRALATRGEGDGGGDSQ